ncbi:MAG: hypothetical protein II652_07215, partial [Bacteroidales bacterium]|nr:hypothetical protein [Bacteroidales bacterium]
LNTAALTGESIPADVQVGYEVISGCVNMTGVIKIETTREFDDLQEHGRVSQTAFPASPEDLCARNGESAGAIPSIRIHAGRGG